MGFSGDSIAAISNGVKWSKLFGSEVSVNAVSNEENSEFENDKITLEKRKAVKEKLKLLGEAEENIEEILFSIEQYCQLVLLSIKNE